MDKPEKELNKKTVSQLKDILRNKGLKLSGNKQELIERILNNQTISKPSPNRNSYFDILPKDITNIVEDYRVKNNLNNLLVEIILNNNQIRNGLKGTWSTDYLNEEIEKQTGLLIKFKTTRIDDLDLKMQIDIGKLPFITDDIFVKFLIFIQQHISGNWDLNRILLEHNSPFRVIYHPAPHWSIEIFKGVQIINTPASP